jgi:hypothetical protein
MTTAAGICNNALYEIGAYAQGETPSAEDMAFALSKFNRLLDTWNSQKLYIFAVNFAQYIMIPGKNPQTIGKAFKITSASLTGGVATFIGVPSNPFFKMGDVISSVNVSIGAGTLNATNIVVASASLDGTTITALIAQPDVGAAAATGVLIPGNQPATAAPDFPITTTRPVKIVNANIILNNTGTPTRVPMRIVDADWWANQRVPTIQTTLPTELYYQASFPNGELFFWPVPQIAYPVELETWTSLSQLLQTDSFVLPQGYEDAITYTLAESLCPAFGRPLDNTLAAFAQQSRALIQSNNSATPLITTSDFGMPGGASDQRGRSDFNWKTGNLSG